MAKRGTIKLTKVLDKIKSVGNAHNNTIYGIRNRQRHSSFFIYQQPTGPGRRRKRERGDGWVVGRDRDRQDEQLINHKTFVSHLLFAGGSLPRTFYLLG